MKKFMLSVVAALALLLGVARSASAVYDGTPSTGSFTVVDVSKLAKAKASGSLVVLSTTAARKSSVTVGTALLTEGQQWSVGTSTVTAAVSLKNAINANQAQAAATFAVGDASIALLALDYGTLYNGVATKTSVPTGVSTSAATLTGGLDDAYITINKVQLTQGRDWFIQDVASNTAINVAAAVNANPTLKNQVEAVALDTQVYLRAVVSPVAYPLTTSVSAGISVSRANMSGGSAGNLARSRCDLGTVNALPTENYPAGCHLFLASDAKDYTSIEKVTGAGSWLANTLVAGAIDTGKLAADAVTGAKILNGTIGTAKLAPGVIVNGEVGAGGIDSAKIAAGAVDTAKLATDSVTLAKIKNGSVDSSKLASGSVDTGKLVSDAVITAKIADAAVDTAKVKSDSITTTKIINGAVDTQKLANGSVTYLKLQWLVTPSATDTGKLQKCSGGFVIGEACP